MYKEWAQKRLTDERVVVYSGPNGEFGFECKNNYSGVMAKGEENQDGHRMRLSKKDLPRRQKQGLFDIFVFTGKRYSECGVSHREILEDVLKYSTLENCFRVWRDFDPRCFTSDENELEVLYTLSLLFFEQELNRGNEIWQRYSYFAAPVTKPKRKRPRDLLMGYIVQAYDIGIENIAYWKKTQPTTFTFRPPVVEKGKRSFDFKDYPEEYKKYFTSLEDDSQAEALMTYAGVLYQYRGFAEQEPDNPYYQHNRRLFEFDGNRMCYFNADRNC